MGHLIFVIIHDSFSPSFPGEKINFPNLLISNALERWQDVQMIAGIIPQEFFGVYNGF
jgi:hypothetical protein